MRSAVIVPPVSPKRACGKIITMSAARSLIAALAKTARKLTDSLEHILRHEPEHPLQQLLQAANETFSTNMEPNEFADMCAQTITYGMFIERRGNHEKQIPKPIPFLRTLFDSIESPDTDARIRRIITELENLLPFDQTSAIQQAGLDHSKTGIEETVYFYEHFLSAYHPELRHSRGVFYTPFPIVRYIVRAVDTILRREFQLPKGLADNVPILDPATGLGTFLFGVIRHIYEQVALTENPNVWKNYVANDLLPRLYGLEIMMTPYLMVHLKLNMFLAPTVGTWENQRFNIYRTNALESQDRFGQFPFLVVLGNPPYNVSTVNQSEYAKNLIAKYKEGLEHETNIQPLSDDYIKFIALGQHLIGSNQSGGILAYISNNSFLDGVIHWKMRKSLLDTFDKIYILNLHGNKRKKETDPNGGRDDNVFNIQQGTSINIFVRNPEKQKVQSKQREKSNVFYADLFGTRTKKYDFLQTQLLAETDFTELVPKEPDYFFVPKDLSLQTEYDKGFGVHQLFLQYGTGIKFRKDNLLVKNHFTRHDVETMLDDIARLDDKQVLAKYKTKETKDWQLQDKRQYFLNYRSEDIVPILYRVFDSRWTYYPRDKISNIIVRSDARKSLMQHLFHDNVVLLTLRNQPTVQDFDRVFIASGIIEHCVIGRGTYAFPLYCYDENGERCLNLNEEIVRVIEKDITSTERGGVSPPVSFESTRLKPGDLRPPLLERANAPSPYALNIFDYVYGVLHDPVYRAKYQEFLKIDFPRIPYPKEGAEFDRYVQAGTRLRKLHLLEEVPAIQTTFPISGNNAVENVRFVDGKVFINGSQYFENVPVSVWNFFIGGSCPAQKYLKDRKGRVLTLAEIQHYQNVAAVLLGTIEILGWR